ncbi:MAG: hypothetical protein K2J40_05280 [Ruminococcus sp.]|nr:hypothetical protein [Ruminococcus sp.]
MKKVCKQCGRERVMLPWEELCTACETEETLRKQQETIKEAESDEDIDTYSSWYVICPYCGNAHRTDYCYEDFPEIYEDGDHELECSECGKLFVLHTDISYSWKTSRKQQ